MKTKLIPLDYDHFDFNGRNFILIIGRDEKGKRITIIDEIEFFFWAILKNDLSKTQINQLIKDIKSIKIERAGRISHISKIELHNKKFLERDAKALKIFITNYKDAQFFAEKIRRPEIEKIREHDLGLITRYILERGLKPLVWYEIEGNLIDFEDSLCEIGFQFESSLSLKLSSFKELKKQLSFKPKILAYDIETDDFNIGKGNILMISLVGENFRKVLTWKKHSSKEFVETFSSEEEMLEKFVEYVKNYDPDFLVGYFSDEFDLPYLKIKSEKHKLKFSLGIDGSEPSFSAGITRTSRIRGIVHIDLFKFIRTVYGPYLQSETLSLNEVAAELLGELKLEWDHKDSSLLNHDEWERYFEYNLQDSNLAFNLTKKIWPDILEFTRIIQEPPFIISRSSMSGLVESYLLHNLHRFNEIAERRPHFNEIRERRSQERYEGAFVLQPTPGIYENLVFFDFTSMYASIIISFNLSKASFLEEKKGDCIEVDLGDKKAYFKKEKSFFASLLEEILDKRKYFKKQLSKNLDDPLLRARSNAFKLLANASYGYQGFFGARYYCLEAAASTTALARKWIKETISMIEKEGYKVVYSDTDSVCFLRDKKSKKEVMQLLAKINQKLPGVMELDLEGFFKRGIWVTKRTGDIGAKKKYALIDEKGKLKIRGFETVRRDWCNLARETQNKILELILTDGNEKRALQYLKEVISKLKKRQISKEKLIIRTKLKRAIEDYKAESPHIMLAKKMKEKGLPISPGMIIEYYISKPKTSSKKTLVRDRAKLIDEDAEYDVDYYLENQILPAVENILELFKVDVHSLLNGKKQRSLMEF